MPPDHAREPDDLTRAVARVTGDEMLTDLTSFPWPDPGAK
jgi:hypothetical protein